MSKVANQGFDVRTFAEKIIRTEGAKYIAPYLGTGAIQYADSYLHMLLVAVEKDENSPRILGEFARMLDIPSEEELDSLIINRK